MTIVGYVISRLKTRVAHTLSRQNLRLPTHFPPPKNTYSCFPAKYEGEMYGISGFIFALFLRTVSEIIFAPYGLRRATLSFLKCFHPLCKCSVVQQTFSNGSRAFSGNHFILIRRARYFYNHG